MPTVIDFSVITNPVALIDALLFFRAKGEHLQVGEHNVVAVDIDFYAPQRQTVTDDLRDPDLARHVSDVIQPGFGSKIDVSNIGLALRVFQYAAQQGYIEIVPGGTGVLPNDSFRNMDLPLAQWYHYTNMAVVPDHPDALREDLRLASARSGSLVTCHDKLLLKKHLAPHGAWIVPAAGAISVKLATRWVPTNDAEVLACIDNPQLLPGLTAAVAEQVEAEAHESDLRLFLPRLLADHATGGTFSLIEILVRIWRQNFRS